MAELTEAERTVLEMIAEDPGEPISPLRGIVERLIARGLVTYDSAGWWAITEAGANVVRHNQPLN